jgi:hypothetical protein
MGLLLRHSRLCFSQPCPNLGFLDPGYFLWAIKWSTVFSGFHSLPPLCCLSVQYLIKLLENQSRRCNSRA